MTISPGGTTPGYKVVGITPGQFGTDAAGNTVQGHLVRYQLTDGTPGEVLVPDRQWAPDTARAAIEAAVTTTYAVRNLGSMGS